MAFARRAPPAAPTGAGQGGQSSAAPEGPTGGEPENRAGLEVQPATGRRAGGGAAPPELRRVVGAGQSAEDLEAASTATSEWTSSGGTGELNVAAQGVRSRLQAQAALLQQFTQEFLIFASCLNFQEYQNSRAAAFNSQARELSRRTDDLADSRSTCLIFVCLLWGRVSAPTECSPRDSGRLLHSRVGSFLTTFSLLVFLFLCLQGPTLT